MKFCYELCGNKWWPKVAKGGAGSGRVAAHMGPRIPLDSPLSTQS
jgi:hypothetical protein